MAVTVRTGSQCLELVTQVSLCYQRDPQTAQHNLEIVKQSTPVFLNELKKSEKRREKKRDELKREEQSLEFTINSKEAQAKQLQRQLQDLKARKARNEDQLEDRKSDLRDAEERKRKASSKKDGAIAGTVVGGVGAIVLGIFFPPSLAVTVPTVAAAGTISITEACNAVDNCQDRIRHVEGLIADDKSEIRSTNYKISGIQDEISTLKSKLHELYSNRGRLRKTISFMQQAVTYFGKLQVAIEGGQHKTNELHGLIKQINMFQEYEILTSNGVTIVAKSFAEAWRQVEDTIMSGNDDGFLNITFQEIPQIDFN